MRKTERGRGFSGLNPKRVVVSYGLSKKFLIESFLVKKCYKRVLRNDCPRPPPLIKFDGGMV